MTPVSWRFSTVTEKRLLGDIPVKSLMLVALLSVRLMSD